MSLWWWLPWVRLVVPLSEPPPAAVRVRILECAPGYYCREELPDGGYGPREDWRHDGVYPVVRAAKRGGAK